MGVESETSKSFPAFGMSELNVVPCETKSFLANKKLGDFLWTPQSNSN